jgi:2-C-methyl-D-erythritol 4-phosphate cytidylyltransferase
MLVTSACVGRYGAPVPWGRAARVPEPVAEGTMRRGPVTVWCVVVAAGSGDRFGGPKQLADLGGRRVVDWSVAAAREVCDGVVVVGHPDRLAELESGFPCTAGGSPTVVAGGATRAASVRAGLRAVPSSADVVLVHDGARPLAGVELFRRVAAAVRSGADAAVPVVPVVDTIRSLDAGTVDRSRLVAVQTPQGFRAAILRSAHRGDPEATDDAALVEGIGGKVVLVDGDPRNLKITGPDDLRVAAALLAGGGR